MPHPALQRATGRQPSRGPSQGSGNNSDSDWVYLQSTPYASYGSADPRKQQTVHVFPDNELPFALTSRLQKDEAEMAQVEQYLRSNHDGGFAQTLKDRLKSAKERVKADDIFVEHIQEIILQAVVNSVKNHTKLGEGSFGQVIKARLPKIDHPDGPMIDVAVKLLRLNANDENSAKREIDNISKEIMTQASLSDHRTPHPNITQLLFEHRWQFGRDLTSTSFCLVMPCATDGALDDHIKILKTLSPHRRELRALQYASDMCDGIDFMHSKGFVHVDVKPKNALVFNDNDRLTIKWTDFGLTCRKGEPLCLAGSPGYLPPEILNPKCNWHLWEDHSKQDPKGATIHRWSSKEDWFSIGVTICEVLGVVVPDFNLPIRLDHRLTRDDYVKCWREYENWYRKLIDRVLELREPVRQCVLFLLKPEPKDRDEQWLRTCIKFRSFDVSAEHLPMPSYLQSGPSAPRVPPAVIDPAMSGGHHHHM